MAQDPVLQREMFNPRDRSARGSGITSMVDDGSSGMTREERLQMAKDMLAEAQMKQSPEYYFNTLAQGDRPAMTRPVASSAPPPAMQPIPPMQQMAQMQAAGVRPVGMADGGIVRHGYDGTDGSFVSPSGPVGLRSLYDNIGSVFGTQQGDDQMYPTIDRRRSLSPEDVEAIEKAQAAEFALRTFDPENDPKNLMTDPDTGQTPEEKEDLRLAMKGKVPYDPYQLEGGLNRAVTYNRPEDPSTWTPDFKEAMIDKIHQEKVAEVKSLPEFKRTAVPSRENIERQVDQSIVDAKVRKGETSATTDASARERAMSNVAMGEGRDYAGDRLGDTLVRAADDRVEKAQQKGRLEASSMETSRREEGVASLGRIAEDQALRDQAMPDKRDYAQGREGLASLGRIAEDKALRDQAMPDKRDYAQERKAATIPGVPGAGVAKDQAGAGGGAAAQEPAKYSATTTLESIKSERAKEREDNFNMALIQAGLAMMGGKSSNALANIGEGGMQGIKQFAEQERESSRGYREDVKGVRDEERFGRTYDQNERMQAASLAAQADVARATREATASENAAERMSREGMFGRTEDRLDRTALDNKLEAVFARELANKEQILREKYQNGTISAQQYANETARLSQENTANYQAASIRMEERKQKFAEMKLPEEVLQAAAFGGWKPDDKGTAPTDEQLMAGLARMNEVDLNKSLEKIINSPFADQELRDKAAARFSANLDKLNNQGSSSVDYNTLPK